MSPLRRRRLLALALVALSWGSVLGGCTSVEGLPSGPSKPAAYSLPSSLALSGWRHSQQTVLSGGSPAPYNYGPAVVEQRGRYRAWWCSQLSNIGPPGDDILYAASRGLDGGFTASGAAPAVPVFTGEPGGFDGKHTCDPSVIAVHGRYYLYYTGSAGDHAHGNAIGVASSPDGLAWRREHGGQPIVRASHDVHRDNVYGAGQPSAVYLDGWYYLMFTDTTAAAAGVNGAGQFVLRARDPEFTRGVQALSPTGFQSWNGIPRKRSVVDAFSADWMWVDALDAFAIAHQTVKGTRITFWDRNFTRRPYHPVLIPGPWQEGPGLVRRLDGHAPLSTVDPCGTVPLDVLRATTRKPAPTDLRHFGVNAVGAVGCG